MGQVAQPQSKPGTAQPRWRAVLRLALGQAQVMGATMTLVLLLQGGPSQRVIWGALLTGIASLASVILFRIVWRNTKGD